MPENSLVLDLRRETRLDDSATAAEQRRRTFPWGLLLRTAVSAGLIWFLLANSELAALRSALAKLDERYWLAALLVYLVSQCVSGHRWYTLGRALGFQKSWRQFQKLYLEGMFFSLCLPSSIGGDVVKAMRLGANARERFLAAGSVFADRLTGLAALCVICATGFLARSWQLGLPAALFLGAGVSLAALVSFLVGQWFLRWNSTRLERIPKLGTILAELNEYNHKPGVVFRAIGWSFIVQLTNVAMVWLLGRGIELSVPASSYFIAVPAVALASTLPLSVNGVGVREGGLALLLQPDGLTEEQGVALGLLWFSITMASGLMGGLAFLAERSREPGERGQEPGARSQERS